MIPLKLAVTGFLSYQETIEIDFTTFELACIAGANGAGKSSLLDAITWVLFGQARKRDESLINTQSSAAEVDFIFLYEGNIYRVIRTLPRGKTSMLEFYMLQNSDQYSANSDLWKETSRQARATNGRKSKESKQTVWKSMREPTLRETQARIEQILSMDYETFVNAAFFLQGKADLFTQQRPGDRKRILSSILGLEVWETYRQRAGDHRKTAESTIAGIDGRLEEIRAELAEEEKRKNRLVELQNDLERYSQMRQTQESALENIRKIAATLAEQARLVETMKRQLDSTMRRLSEMETRQSLRKKECEDYHRVIARSGEIEAAYTAWQQARLDLERWEGVAAQFREQEKRRQEPLDEINAARVRMTQELDNLLKQQNLILAANLELKELDLQLEAARRELALAENELKRRVQLDEDLQTARQRQAEARAENPRLKAEMDELKERIDRLGEVEGANCPLCGQPLQPEDRQRLMNELTVKGKEMGDRYRANQTLMRESDRLVQDLERQIAALALAEATARAQARKIDQINDRLEIIQKLNADWESQDAPRMQVIQRALAEETFAPEARAHLAEIDAELKAIGYDAAAHDEVRKAEQEGRAAEERLRGLERARAALAPIEREINELETQIVTLQAEVNHQQSEHDQAAESLALARSQAPDLFAAEKALMESQEQENRVRMEVGAARQKVLVLDDLKVRRKSLEVQREEQARLVGRYKQLERAFGKDGVPALLIEQALPEIERKANEILDRLSGGNMSVRFVTQAAFKDKHREDLKETLDILISDGVGSRDYETYSGGESFRVNFAIRLALSEVLAQRAGARLQTLVIDEGFGNQDAIGRQRLIEVINSIRQDFSKILVISHIDEIKDAFPCRIEVEKTDRGSTVKIM